MNSKFYTSVETYGNTVYIREVIDGIRNNRKTQWGPTVYLKGPGEFKTLYGDQAKAMKFDTISACKEFVNTYSDTSNFEVFGQLNYSLQFMGAYQMVGNFDMSKMRIFSLDIETRTLDTGFAKPEDAAAEIILITVQDVNTGRCFTFGTLPTPDNCTYTRYLECKDEETLLKQFLGFWEQSQPDIVTGWNIEGFDIPYIINRITSVLGEEYTSKLSVWGKVECKTKKNKQGKEELFCKIFGLQILDYLTLMKKFTYGNRASWSLGAVAQEELGETKTENPGKDFRDFYTNYTDTFIEYNCRDSVLVTKLDKRMKLLELAITLAFLARINFEEVYSPVKMWDNIIHNKLLDEGIVIPQRKSTGFTGEGIEGAYVKTPEKGVYEDCCSLDATSLYPSIMETLNLSPETYLGKIDMDVDKCLAGQYPDYLVERNVSMGANGTMYTKEFRGIIPRLITEYMARRKSAKKEMLSLEQVREDHKKSGTPIPEDLENKIASLNNLQMAIKIAANSLYGAMANAGFRFFEPDVAESITLTGQLYLRSIEKYINNDIASAFKLPYHDFLTYVDTDSGYFTLKPIIDKFAPESSGTKRIEIIEKLTRDKIVPLVNNITTRVSGYINAYEHKISFKQEIAADKIMFFGKKMYVCRVFSSEGVRYSKPKFKTMGIAMVRSGTPSAVQHALQEALPIMFDGGETATQQYILKVRENFDKLSVDDVAKISGVNNMDEYSSGTSIYQKGCPIHVRGALLHNYHINLRHLTTKYKLIGDGDKVKMVYLKKPNPIRENIIAWNVDDKLPPELNLQDYIDWDTQFDKVFKDAMRNMMEPLGWSTEAVADLSEFF